MENKINELGKKLVRCNFNCDGINNNPNKGIIPRCLILEKRNGKNNCIVVGLNPGKCNEKERQYYIKNSIKYSSILRYFLESNLHNAPYFKRTRDLISGLNFNGDILWTDLAKCECLGQNGSIPIQTLRVCINRFLRKEIEIFKCSTIFALGNDAYRFCALSFPNHFIVGIPHPSGSYGNFAKIKKQVMSNKKHFIQNMSLLKDSNNNFKAIHLAKI